MNQDESHPTTIQGAPGWQLLRMRGAAAYLGCSVSTIYRAMAKYGLPARRMGGYWVISKVELDAWIKTLPGINLTSAS